MNLKTVVVILNLFVLSWASVTEAQSATSSFFEQHLKKETFPYPLSKLKLALEGLAKTSSKNIPQQPDLIYNLIPFGRSLHAGSTDFSHPRVLFAYTPSKYTSGFRMDYQDLVDRLFVSYSEVQNSLEVISWNNFEGRYNFESVKNFIPSPDHPQILLKDSTVLANGFTQRQLCMTCHQSGAPLYADKPWSESSASFGINSYQKSAIAAKIEESLQSKTYLGLVIDPTDANGNRSAAAGEIHLVIKAANSALMNARRIAKQSCGNNLACREQYLTTVLNLARTPYYENTDTYFVTMLPYRDELQKYINIHQWPSHEFSYANPTLPDRNPLIKPAQMDYIRLSPTKKRELINFINLDENNPTSFEYASAQMIMKGYEGFGFLFSNLPLIRKCSNEDFQNILKSTEYKKIISEWNLNDTDHPVQKFTPLYEQVLNLFSRCNL